MLKECLVCGNQFNPRRATSKYCSRHCLWKTNGKTQIKKPFVWWKNNKGYIEGRVTVNGVTRRMKYHRWVMEQELGYRLPPHVDVHHLDGNKLNNHPSNFQIIEHGKHTTVTHNGKRHTLGKKLKLTPTERKRRAEHMKVIRLKTIAKAEGRK